MKRLLSILAIFILVLSLACLSSCGKDDDSGSNPPSSDGGVEGPIIDYP